MENFKIQEKTLELLIKGVNHSEYNSLKDHRMIWNIAGFINIISYDLKVIGRDLFFTDNEWQKRYYARQASLIMYEGLGDLFILLGKDFKKLISTKFITSDFERQLKQIRTDLNIFKEQHNDRLKHIRNVAIAHRDNNILKQIETIQKIEWIETINTLKQFDNILNALGQVFQQIIDGLNNLSTK
jgi:hypothetical protein